jgi:hypothetical protein
MKKPRRVLVLFSFGLLVAIVATSCRPRREIELSLKSAVDAGPGADGPLKLAADAGSTADAACPEEGPLVPCMCKGTWYPDLILPTPWWVEGGVPAECIDAPLHDPPEIYDECELNAYGIPPSQCGAPSSGAVVCERHGKRGLLTLTCVTASDCPPSMVCITPEGIPGDVDTSLDSESGSCHKSCGSDGGGDCIRCDLPCDAEWDYCGGDPYAGTACDDGVDNDSDGVTDYPAECGCASTADEDEDDPTPGACCDDVDNDGDGLTDYPADPGCGSAGGDVAEDGPPCDDGVDDDGDGVTDYPAECGCVSPTDEDEEDPVTSAPCCDGLDNDDDGLTDYPEDPGCSNAGGDDGEGAACDDGADNDGDGVTDYPAECGCVGPTDDNEVDVGSSVCCDGFDNDGDGLIDYPDDPGCSSAGGDEDE